MKNLCRFITIALLLLAMLLFATASSAQARPPAAEKLAKTYGLDSFGQIEAIRYTFNLNVPGLFKVSRSWEWEPKTNKVTYDGPDKDGKPIKVTYLRTDLGSQSDMVKKVVDPAFINDNYWLLFPFHAYWDNSATITDQGLKKLPSGVGSADLVAVKYPAEGSGYTPGDTWELYLGKDSRISLLVFHHGGSVRPSLVTATWAGYKMAGPLLVSTDHRGNADGKPLNLSLSNVAVKLVGSDKWLDAK